MTNKKKQKRAIRARAEESGISYPTARRAMGINSAQSSASAVESVSDSKPDAETIRRRKEAAMSFPLHAVIARYRRDHHVSEADAATHERELRRYLCLASLYPGDGLPMVTTIDPLWHTFIVFTKQYHAFSSALNVPYIHHEPFDEDSDRSGLDERYGRLLAHYRLVFGEPPPDIWPPMIDGEFGSDCVDCDQQCQGQCAGSD